MGNEFLSEEMIAKCTPISTKKAKVFNMLASVFVNAMSVTPEYDTDLVRSIKRFNEGHWLHSVSLDTLEGTKLWDLVADNMPTSRRKKALFRALAKFAHDYFAEEEPSADAKVVCESVKDLAEDVAAVFGYDLDDGCSLFGIYIAPTPSAHEEVKEEETEETAFGLGSKWVVIEKMRESLQNIRNSVECADFGTYKNVNFECDNIEELLTKLQ